MALEFPEPDPITVSMDAIFTWDHPATREDETSLPLDEIDHYELFYGLVSDTTPVMIDVGKANTYRIEGLPPGEYSSAIRAVDINGIQGVMSEEVSFTIMAPSRPTAPGGLNAITEDNYTALAVDQCMKSGECVADIGMTWK